MASYDPQKVGTYVIVLHHRDQSPAFLALNEWTLSPEAAVACTRKEALKFIFSSKQGVCALRYLDALRLVRAGCKKLWRPRGSPVVIGIYLAKEADMDVGADSPYAVVCEDHASILGEKTLRSAEASGMFPTEWCEDCRTARNERVRQAKKT